MIDRGSQMVPVEVKSGQTVNEDFFKALHHWRRLPGQGDCPAVLVYGGELSHTRHGVVVTSWRDWGVA